MAGEPRPDRFEPSFERFETLSPGGSPGDFSMHNLSPGGYWHSPSAAPSPQGREGSGSDRSDRWQAGGGQAGGQASAWTSGGSWLSSTWRSGGSWVVDSYHSVATTVSSGVASGGSLLSSLSWRGDASDAAAAEASGGESQRYDSAAALV